MVRGRAGPGRGLQAYSGLAALWLVRECRYPGDRGRCSLVLATGSALATLALVGSTPGGTGSRGCGCTPSRSGDCPAWWRSVSAPTCPACCRCRRHRGARLGVAGTWTRSAGPIRGRAPWWPHRRCSTHGFLVALPRSSAAADCPLAGARDHQRGARPGLVAGGRPRRRGVARPGRCSERTADRGRRRRDWMRRPARRSRRDTRPGRAYHREPITTSTRRPQRRDRPPRPRPGPAAERERSPLPFAADALDHDERYRDLRGARRRRWQGRGERLDARRIPDRPSCASSRCTPTAS